MIEVVATDSSLVVRLNNEEMRPRHASQLAFWGFARSSSENSFHASADDPSILAAKIVDYLSKQKLEFRVDSRTGELLAERANRRKLLQEAIERCASLKAGRLDIGDSGEFVKFISSLPRRLKDHQVKAALHLLHASNGANFSVPGSGKTTVVLAVFSWLKSRGQVDAIFVVGPPSCFDPWRIEYEAVIGSPPRCETLAGGNIEDRRGRYLVDAENASDLYLTTFQTLHRDWHHVRRLFEQRGVRFFFVVDEAHYIKQPDGAWAEAVMGVTRHAVRRCILTGTPFPRSYVDAFNLFDVLWPDDSPIASEKRHQIERFTQQKNLGRAAETLSEAIGPLFYRVRKSDLHLAPQVFHEPIQIEMNTNERLVYDSIIERIQYASQSDFFRDFDLLVRLRRGRMVRLRQCISYTALLASAVKEYSEELVADPSIADIIRHYDELEIPAKMSALFDLVSTLRAEGQKIVIWSNFVRTLHTIADSLRSRGHGVEVIFGGTPFERSTVEEELSREQIIRRFTSPNSGTDILVANPAACAESISLHKACSHAIYYDLSYNCAQYLQSLDRIHRVGGSENVPAHYYVLQYQDTLDLDVLDNLHKKSANMSAVIDEDYPLYSMDMFSDDDELEAYDRLFGKHR